jgi:hypothetical protein
MATPIITDELRKKYTQFQISKLENHVPILKPCNYCGNIFDAQSYVFRPTAIYTRINEFCSSICIRIGAGKKNKKIFREYICEYCNNPYTPTRSKVHQKFCSKLCYSNSLKNISRPEMQRWIHKITPPTNSISKQEIIWLEQFDITHYQHLIKINNRSYRVDGYDQKTNTIYEFLGSFWHGNPEIYSPTDINPRNKKSFGQLYQETMNRLNLFETSGYNVVYYWNNR